MGVGVGGLGWGGWGGVNLLPFVRRPPIDLSQACARDGLGGELGEERLAGRIRTPLRDRPRGDRTTPL